MASRNADSAVHATLVATIKDTVTLNNEAGEVVIYNRSGTSDIFARWDGADPGIGADNSHVIRTNSERRFGPPITSAIEVRLISAGIPQYSVETV